MKTAVESIFTILVIILALAATCRGVFVDDSTAVRALEKQGYSQVVVTNHVSWCMGWNGCSGSDAARIDAKAKNPAGVVVNVYVCVGWPFKGATVRTD